MTSRLLPAQAGAETYSFTAEYQDVGVAGYDNSYGYYIKDGNGDPTEGAIIWANVKDDAIDPSIEIFPGYPPEQVGFFIIPDGAGQNPDLADGDDITFQQVGGVWQALQDGTELTGEGANIFFDNAALNVDGYSHVQDNEWAGNQNWEDLLWDNGFRLRGREHQCYLECRGESR